MLNKKIAFIGPIFHSYHLLIKQKLESLGAEVDFYPEIDFSLKFKIINNFFNKSLDDYQKEHYLSILDNHSKKNYDYLFVIRGYKMPAEFLIGFKKQNPCAQLIMYQWDSQKSNSYIHLVEFFNKCYSFDFKDCADFKIKYLPLFYCDDVKDAISDKVNASYDFFFMGWYMPTRYEAILKFKKYAKTRGFNLKAFLYIPITSYLKECIKGNILSLSFVSFKSMNRKSYLDFLKQSKVMVDVSSPNQTGLAMRVIEALASNTKVLTNNKNILKESFFDEKVINFYDEQSPEINKDFLNYVNKNQPIGLFSLDDWLRKIFSA